MSKEEIQKSLEQLRDAINKLQGKDEDNKVRVQRLISDLEHQLANPEDDEHKATVIDGLQNSIEHFESEHPDLTSVLNHIMVTLSNMGI